MVASGLGQISLDYADSTPAGASLLCHWYCKSENLFKLLISESGLGTKTVLSLPSSVVVMLCSSFLLDGIDLLITLSFVLAVQTTYCHQCSCTCRVTA